MTRHRAAVIIAPLLTVLALAGTGVWVAVSRSHAPHAPATVPTGVSPHRPGWGLPPAGQSFPPAQSVAVTPTAVMWDTITLATVPAHPFALAGYTAGFWPTFLPLRARWPQAHTVSIAIRASDHADCLDVEPGDAIPSQVVAWIDADRRAGFTHPCVYSSYWEFTGQIRPRLAAAHIARSSIYEWDADYTHRPHLDSSFDATQWTDRALGRNLDQSAVTYGFLSIAQPPYIAPSPKPKPRPKPSPALIRLRGQHYQLRHDLAHHGCDKRLREHQPLGPRCRAWRSELKHVDARIRVLR